VQITEANLCGAPFPRYFQNLGAFTGGGSPSPLCQNSGSDAVLPARDKAERSWQLRLSSRLSHLVVETDYESPGEAAMDLVKKISAIRRGSCDCSHCSGTGTGPHAQRRRTSSTPTCGEECLPIFMLRPVSLVIGRKLPALGSAASESRGLVPTLPQHRPGTMSPVPIGKLCDRLTAPDRSRTWALSERFTHASI